MSTVIVVCDLSKPQNVLTSLLRSFEAIEDLSAKRAAELKAVNVNALNDLREQSFATLKDHADANRLKPTDISSFIIGKSSLCFVAKHCFIKRMVRSANKFDVFTKSVKPAERRAVLQVLRFVAHLYGSGVLTTINGPSETAAGKEIYRSLLTSLCFNGAIKPCYDVAGDKMVYITRGAFFLSIHLFLYHDYGFIFI